MSFWYPRTTMCCQETTVSAGIPKLPSWFTLRSCPIYKRLRRPIERLWCALKRWSWLEWDRRRNGPHCDSNDSYRKDLWRRWLCQNLSHEHVHWFKPPDDWHIYEMERTPCTFHSPSMVLKRKRWVLHTPKILLAASLRSAVIKFPSEILFSWMRGRIRLQSCSTE